MNEEFNKQYLILLRRQVEEEIQFLVRSGHDNAITYTPCLFCIEHPHNSYLCLRMTDLRSFLAKIASQESHEKHNPKQRRRIGFENDAYTVQGLNIEHSFQPMPLLSVKL